MNTKDSWINCTNSGECAGHLNGFSTMAFFLFAFPPSRFVCDKKKIFSHTVQVKEDEWPVTLPFPSIDNHSYCLHLSCAACNNHTHAHTTFTMIKKHNIQLLSIHLTHIERYTFYVIQQWLVVYTFSPHWECALSISGCSRRAVGYFTFLALTGFRCRCNSCYVMFVYNTDYNKNVI